MPRPAHFERLLRFLRQKGRSREDAEDLIQEAMLRMHIYCQGVAVTNEEAFLRNAVSNLSIDQHRRERSAVRQGVPIEEANTASQLVEAGSTPERTLEAQQRLGHIRALLDAVSRRTRDIYFAHRAGYSYSEIADHMGISQVTIRRHIARALLAVMEHSEMDDDGIAHRATE